VNLGRSKFWPFWGLLFISLCLSFSSYAFVDPNLLLLNSPVWVEVQQWFWQALGHWDSLALGYFVLVSGWWGFYLWGAKRSSSLKPSPLWLAVALCVGILWLGHNALSHDIFNYLFNAKMVVEYSSNPHVRTAIEFAYDPWVRFMHNIHTPAPYGYGWTAVSLLPYWLGLGSFLLSYLAMKAWMILGLGLYLSLGWRLLDKWPVSDRRQRLWLFALNPILLWETALNGHNDVWMMWPALAAFFLVIKKDRQLWHVVLAGVLLAFSISIKLVTIVLVPIILFLVLWPLLKNGISKLSIWLERLGDHLYGFWPEYASLVLLVPLVTSRSQQFLPWYLIWSWSFFPLHRWRWLRWLLLALTVTSQLRYVPWLLNGLEYTTRLQQEMRIVTWTAVPLVIVLGMISLRSKLLPKNK